MSGRRSIVVRKQRQTFESTCLIKPWPFRISVKLKVPTIGISNLIHTIQIEEQYIEVNHTEGEFHWS